MSFRDTLRNVLFTAVQRSGPAMLAGITLGGWVRLLRDNGFAVDMRCIARATAISLLSAGNSVVTCFERGGAVCPEYAGDGRPPLFILGHWRSGTTHLHNLLACDRRFAAPTLYQVLFPQSFRATEWFASHILSTLLGGARGFDNVRVAFDLPNEDEFAIALLSGCSPYLALAFPRRRVHYRRFLTMLDTSSSERSRWRAALTGFVSKVVRGTDRAPLLKSPPHTCRIRLLLELFPGAKFMHVHRHPHEVYASRRAQLAGKRVRHNLQIDDSLDVEEEVISIYREMHESFFRECPLIPPGSYHEIEYEDLRCEPIAELRTAYGKLSLGNFAQAEAPLRRYLASIAGYAGNRYGDVPADTRRRLAQEWRQSFDEWGYVT